MKARCTRVALWLHCPETRMVTGFVQPVQPVQCDMGIHMMCAHKGHFADMGCTSHTLHSAVPNSTAGPCRTTAARLYRLATRPAIERSAPRPCPGSTGTGKTNLGLPTA